MGIYRHADHCPALRNAEALCVCERPRYVKAFLIGLPLALFEHAAGFSVGSETLNADAWHLFGDVTHDLLAIAIISFIIVRPLMEPRLRAWGGFAQAALLLASAALILAQVLIIGIQPGTNGWVMLVVGSIAAFLNWKRFRVLHPDGSPFALVRDIALSVRNGAREITTYIGEIFHVLTDVGVSIFAALSGVIVILFSAQSLDDVAALGVAAFLVAGAFITIIFARRHHHHHH